MFSYLWKRNQTFYYRIKVPSDLLSLFPSPLIRISLKTRNLDAAKVSSANIHQKVQNGFALLRSGAIDNDLRALLVNGLLPSKKHFIVKTVEEAHTHGPTLSQAIKAHFADRSPHWAEKTKMEFQCQYQVLVSILGDKPVETYTRADLVACREVLQNLPPNFSKKKGYREIPPAELSKHEWPETLKPRSINTYISLLCTLFRWMQDHQYIEANIASGLMLPIETAPQDERKPYSAEDIQRIKSALPRGADHPEKYWIPLIAMYSGMRLDEICQLHLEDLREEDGIICFDVNDAGERNVKTRSSRRLVPVHPGLIAGGFQEYVQHRREVGAERVWENIKPDKLGDWGKWFGNWYGRFNRQHVTQDPLKVFHSFRHTVADTLKQKGVPEGVIAEILGHANGSITTGRYGKRFRPGVLLDALNKLDYGECL